MGFSYNGQHSSNFGLICKTVDIPLIPTKRRQTEYIQGRDGAYIFDSEGFEEKEIIIKCTFVADISFDARRYYARQIAKWLSAESGDLILDSEADKKYKARIDNSIAMTFDSSLDTFTISFKCYPIAFSIFENIENLTWDEAAMIWSFADMTWDIIDIEKSFTVTGATTIIVQNLGTYEVLPLIKLSGTATSITLTDDAGNSFTYSGLTSGTDIYIDCNNKLVYSISNNKKVNQRSNFSGDYLKLLSGENTINVSGNSMNVNIEFDYKNAYI